MPITIIETWTILTPNTDSYIRVWNKAFLIKKCISNAFSDNADNKSKNLIHTRVQIAFMDFNGYNNKYEEKKKK